MNKCVHLVLTLLNFSKPGISFAHASRFTERFHVWTTSVESDYRPKLLFSHYWTNYCLAIIGLMELFLASSIVQQMSSHYVFMRLLRIITLQKSDQCRILFGYGSTLMP